MHENYECRLCYGGQYKVAVDACEAPTATRYFPDSAFPNSTLVNSTDADRINAWIAQQGVAGHAADQVWTRCYSMSVDGVSIATFHGRCDGKGPTVTAMRLETGSVHKARRAGAQQTSGDVVLFLDADNCLAPDYIECGLKEFVSLKVGVVYADLQRFGQYDHDRTNFPPFTRGRLLRFNFVHCKT